MIHFVESIFITNDSIIKILFFSGDVRQCLIGNSNSSNTKYFYDSPISYNSNTQISNYFLTVQTEWFGNVYVTSLVNFYLYVWYTNYVIKDNCIETMTRGAWARVGALNLHLSTCTYARSHLLTKELLSVCQNNFDILLKSFLCNV